MASEIPDLTLNNGSTIPQLGFGVFQVPPEDTAEVTAKALEVGYRHIDTAEMYGNEKGVGEAIRASGIPRDEIFVTSKLNNGFHEPDAARRAFDQTLADLDIGHVDLFLMHWPLPTRYGGDFVATWQTMTEFTGDGRARAVGVSNFQPDHLQRIAEETGVLPAVNQIEVHPYFANEAARKASTDASVLVEAWSPIAQGGVLKDPAITQIAERVGKSPAQVVLRWHLQRGDVIFPKSTHEERMRENIDLFDVELSADDMAALDALDKGEEGRTGPNPDTFDYIPD
ncbi:oxidoreductase [Marmoricola endophyticus]|uniref:Oxidoreductase n=1 Tax=Marmoricola endophyticus TaxID=2040280 RepID=A0A917F4B4_9ACTN|nr:aldo/keto reductase [Marmoricola endophyticus]GGF44917.1 oxidoreductase [Marmoricola endophyticus]